MKNKKRWKSSDQANLYHRLGHLLNRGYTLLTAIEFLMLYVSDDKKKDLQFILLKLKQGAPFYLSFYTLKFSRDGISYIYFAEKYGDLATGLLNAGKMLQMKDTYKKNITKVLRYPLFLIVFLIIVAAIMQKVLIPQFIELYQSMDLPQSNIISMIIFIKSAVPFIGMILIILFLSFIPFYFLSYRKKTAIAQNIFLCKIPLLCYAVRKYNTYFFSFHFGNLLENGLSINEALSVFEKQSHILFFQEEAKRIRSFLLDGDRLPAILKNTTYYDKELATVIVHGQANGILSSELLEYSSLIIEEFEEKFTTWLRILQPTIMLLIGLLVVLLYLAIMLPIYGTLQSL